MKENVKLTSSYLVLVCENVFLIRVYLGLLFINFCNVDVVLKFLNDQQLF